MTRPGNLAGRLLVASVLVLGAGCGAEEGEPGNPGMPWFEDVADDAGVDFLHVRALTSRHWLPEIMSGGAAWLDYDNDGDPDLYLVQGGSLDPADGPSPGNRLYRNNDGSFEDVTVSSGTGHTGYGMGVAVADYDRDGDLDFYVTNVGANVLYRNEGDGTFNDVSASEGVDHPGWGASSAWLDFDLDGDLDLFVTNYVNWSPGQELECSDGGYERDYCHPRHFNAPTADVLYRNDGGRFTDVSETAGIWKARGYGLGVVPGDFDADGWPDIYVANDGMPNQLWINGGDGTFVDRALITGTAVNLSGTAEAGMGVAVADLENDGDLDIFVTHLRGETNTLYLNEGDYFEDVTATTGLAAPSVALTGFGTGFADFDNDGYLDVYVGNGRVGRGLPAAIPFSEPNQLFRGLGGVRFEPVTPSGGTATQRIDNTRAVAFADYDLDGGVDAIVVNNGGWARLLHNVIGAKQGWLELEVRGRDGFEAIGARVEVVAGDRVQWRTVGRASSYLTSNSAVVHIGVGNDSVIDEVIVHWPDGSTTSYGPLQGRAVYSLRRGVLTHTQSLPAPQDGRIHSSRTRESTLPAPRYAPGL